MSEDQQPRQIFAKLQSAFTDLLEVTQVSHTIFQEQFHVYKAPTIQTILHQIEENPPELDLKRKQNKDDLIQLAQNPELITTNFYTQQLVKFMESKKVKQESINCSYLHALHGLPSLAVQKQKLKQCKLYSYKLGQEQEFRHLKSIQPNVYQINPILQISNHQPNKFIVHISIFHPFTNKKTQEIVMHQSATVQDLIKEIDCPVEKTQLLYYPHELQQFEDGYLTFGQKNQQISDITIQLCKQYHYIHLNQCKHRIYIHEIRSNTQNEENQYQIRTIYKAPMKIKACEGCGRSAQLFRVQDNLINGSPVYLCNFCDKQLHKEDDEKGLPYLCD